MRTRLRLSAVIAACFSMLLSVHASAVTSPYEKAFTTKAAYPDTTGSGSATADASALVDGTLNAAASATSDRPVGAVFQLGGWYRDVGIGGSEATAHAGVEVTFRNLAAGTHTISVDLTDVRSRMRLSPVTANPNLSGYGTLGGSGHSEAILALYYYPCQEGSYCNATYWDHTWQWLLGNSGVNGDFHGDVSLSRTFTTYETGRVWVQAYLFTAAAATGEDASADMQVSGKVTRIDLS